MTITETPPLTAQHGLMNRVVLYALTVVVRSLVLRMRLVLPTDCLMTLHL